MSPFSVIGWEGDILKDSFHPLLSLQGATTSALMAINGFVCLFRGFSKNREYAACDLLPRGVNYCAAAIKSKYCWKPSDKVITRYYIKAIGMEFARQQSKR